jgi:hypothetical protein
MLFYDSQGLEVVVYCLFLLLSNIREETHHRFKSTSTKVAKSIKVGLEAGFIFIGSSYIYIKKKEQRKEKQKDTGQTETRFDPTCRGGARKK